MAALLMLIGGLIGGEKGVIIALVIAIGVNFFSWFYSDKMVLSMYHAREVNGSTAPDVYRMVQNLTNHANIPMPRVYIVPSPSPNAFATGRDPSHAAICFTEGILRTLTMSELEGVASHELSHVKNRDILVMSIAATIAMAIGFLAQFGRLAIIFGGGRRGGGLASLFWIILAPIIALLIQMAISRTREYGADQSGAEMTGQPLELADALKKISAVSQVRPQVDLANPSTAHMWISSPLAGTGGIMSLFRTHPPIQERVRRLERMAGME